MGWDAWQEDERWWVPVSALQHYSYCPRQCALIHVEQVFEENLFTLKGRMAHARVDRIEYESRPGVRIERALPIWSEKVGLIGRADVVEFHDNGHEKRIIPVEYKHGKRHHHHHDDIQVCAQAMCLEEMFQCVIPTGVIFHMGSNRRREVELTKALRDDVEDITTKVREMLVSSRLPDVLANTRCTHCSLIDACMPYVIQRMHHLEKEEL